MSESARELVQRMVEAGEWPDPKLLDQILATGQEAVEPLLEIVRSQPHGWPEEAPLDHAITLLGILHPPEALPPLVELFRRYDDSDFVEILGESLSGYGADVFEPALEVVRDGSLRAYTRTMATTLARSAAAGDPERLSQLAATLREQLADHIARAPEKPAEKEGEEGSEEELAEEFAEEGFEEETFEGEVENEEPGSLGDFYSSAGYLVCDLADMADPQARDLIKDAFDAEIIDEMLITPEDVEDIYQRGGDQPQPADPRAPLERYRENYREHLREQRRPTRYSATPIAPPRASAEDDYLAPRQPYLGPERKIGRLWEQEGALYGQIFPASLSGV
ncbi:MAG: hypothetical protein L0Z62_15785, partial [Gemmataceae bacterium]|nr:hypothetical protein [Gemmataceae bacterium]